jgi:hypothetical protein
MGTRALRGGALSLAIALAAAVGATGLLLIGWRLTTKGTSGQCGDFECWHGEGGAFLDCLITRAG